MGYLKIRCGRCGKKWRVYDGDEFNSDSARTCPKCGEQVDEQTWINQVLPAFGCMRDANAELHKDALGYGLTRFKVSYKAID